MTTTFRIGIRGCPPDVSPIKRDKNPKLKFLMDELDETFFMDEDDASASVEVKDLDQLKLVLAFFEGKRVHLEIISELKEGNLTSNASIDENRVAGWTHVSEEPMSVTQATEKIIAICRAIEKQPAPKP